MSDSDRMLVIDENDIFGTSGFLNEASPVVATRPQGKYRNAYAIEESINEKEFRRALDRFFTQSQNISSHDADVGESIDPRNPFEVLLRTVGMELKKDGEGKVSTYIANRLSHPTFVKNLDKFFEENKQKMDEFLKLFEEEIESDCKLQLYLSPSVSERGLSGTFFRALLLARSTQPQAFDILMKKAEHLAKRSGGDNANCSRLASACIGQIRYLEVIYDPKPLFNSIFDRDIESWCTSAREILIQALPEILLNAAVQQDAAENLGEMFLKEVSGDSLAYRSVILSTLMILRCDMPVSRKIRRSLLRNIMKVEADVIPELVNYCLNAVHKDEKFGYSDVFFGLRNYLKMEKLRIRRTDQSKTTVDIIVADIFEQIAKKARFVTSRFWKEIVFVLQNEGKMGEDDGDSMELGEDPSVSDSREYGLFDISLSFALMSIENCDRGVLTAFKHQITYYQYRVEQFKEDIQVVLDFSQFSLLFLPSLLDFCEQLMWSTETNFAHLGAFILGRLFVVVTEHRDEVLKHMMLHLNDVDCEASAILGTLELLAKNYAADLIPFTAVFHNEFKLLVDGLLSSTNRKERIWGVLGMLMELQAQLQVNEAFCEVREQIVENTLLVLDKRTKDDSQVRAVFYTHLTDVIANNPRISPSEAVLEWSEKLQMEFRTLFFEKRGTVQTLNCYEDVRFTRPSHNEWLLLSEVVLDCDNDRSGLHRGRVFELIPLFLLLRAFARQRQRWQGDDTQQANVNHWTQFLFAFEANISMKGVDAEASGSVKRRFNSDVFSFAIQWIRLMLNTFSECEIPDPILDTLIKDLMKKKFALMIECQKSLVFTIRRLGDYSLLHLQGYRKEIVVQSQKSTSSRKGSSNPKPKAKKQIGDVGGDEPISDNEVLCEKKDDDNDAAKETTIADKENVGIDEKAESVLPNRKRKSDHFRKMIDVERVLLYFSPLKLLAVTKLIELLPEKRKQTQFLLEKLQKIIKVVLPKKEKKFAPWMVASEAPLEEVPVNHGDQKAIWRMIHTLLPLLFRILNGAVNYFSTLHDTTAMQDTTERDLFNDMALLMNASLLVLKDIFVCNSIAKPSTSREEAAESERDRRARFERRKCVMEKLERAMIEADAVEDTEGAADAEVAVLNYFINIAQFVPTLNCAVALLHVFSSVEILPEEERLKTARIALSYLRKEWTDEEGNPLKGSILNRAVSEILLLYVKLRRNEKRFLAIQWLLAAEVSSLVPEEERRRSKISSLEECKDEDLTEEDVRAVYKILFNSLNETVKFHLALPYVISGAITLDQCFLQWKRAASCFCLLTLMIRVKDLRNSNVLICAAREGRIFLQSFVTKSSFMYLLQDEKRFAKYAAGANAVLKTVQIGNRSLQNMSVFAKTKKCAVLLKMLPELRAVSELFIRTVHSIMVGADCDEAFQIGLLKSRNLDGEEVKCGDETVEDEEERDREEGDGGPDDGDVNDEEELQEDDATLSRVSPTASTISEVY